MNLHKIARSVISQVNPSVTASIQKSTGYTTQPDGTRTPTYGTASYVRVQSQAMTSGDLQQVSGLNITGERRTIYLSGNWEGVCRQDGDGGDIITMPDKSVWLVVQVAENWGGKEGWVKLLCVRQMS